MRVMVPMWICSITGREFRDKQSYKDHTQRLWDKRKQDRKTKTFAGKLLSETSALTTFPELSEWIIKTVSEYPEYFRLPIGSQISSVSFNSCRYSENCSNSHGCPPGEVTNWGRYRQDLPGGYPGVECQMTITSDIPDVAYSVARGMGAIGIYSGTGNGTRIGYMSYATIWAACFPKLMGLIAAFPMRGTTFLKVVDYE